MGLRAALVLLLPLAMCGPASSSSSAPASSGSPPPPPTAPAWAKVGGLKGRVEMSADCTREVCPPDDCCHSCGLGLHFYAERPEDTKGGDHWDLVGHACRADGCGRPLPCEIPAGEWVLPRGAYLQPTGGGFFQARIGPPGGPAWR